MRERGPLICCCATERCLQGWGEEQLLALGAENDFFAAQIVPGKVRELAAHDRALSTLDHLTRGRLAWNIVSGLMESTARAVGLKSHIPHDERYAVAEDYVELMYKLWEASWEDGAALRDKARKVFVDPARVHTISHEGPYLRANAIHLSEPSAQRTPLLFSAGSSPAGLEFVGRHAECAFISYGSRDFARKQVQQIRDKAV